MREVSIVCRAWEGVTIYCCTKLLGMKFLNGARSPAVEAGKRRLAEQFKCARPWQTSSGRLDLPSNWFSSRVARWGSVSRVYMGGFGFDGD